MIDNAQNVVAVVCSDTLAAKRSPAKSASALVCCRLRCSLNRASDGEQHLS